MNKENKTTNNVTTKSNKKYIVLALVVILFLVGIMINNRNATEQEVVSSASETTAPTVAVEEAPVARIAITTKLVDENIPQFEVYIDDSDTPEKQTKWMTEFNLQGYAITGDKDHIDITVKMLNDAELLIGLRGKYLLDENQHAIEKWVKFTSFTINGVSVLEEPVEVWHHKPFEYTLNANAGETYKLHVEWTKADR